MKAEWKQGLVLEGGAMRGLFSAGIIDVFMEAKIEFDALIGVSAGAAFGCNYKSLQPGRAIRYNKAMARDWRFCSVRSLLLTGDLFGAEFAYHTIPAKIDIFDREAYKSNPMAFVAVCTDVETGMPVYKQLDEASEEAFDWIRASASMPLCSRIVHLEGYGLLDGGIADSIPLEYMESRGCMRNVVVLTQPLGYEKGPSKAMPLIRLALRKHPQLVKAMQRRHVMYNKQLRYVEDAEKEGRAFVIRPPHALPIGHISHDPAEMQAVYDIGRDTAISLLPNIKNFLNI